MFWASLAESVRKWLPPSAIVGCVMGVQTWQFHATSDLQHRTTALEVKNEDDRQARGHFQRSVQRDLDSLDRKMDRLVSHLLKEKP